MNTKATTPGEEEEAPDDTEPLPPGEHKREPIKDPDPADTKLHVHDEGRIMCDAARVPA
jgi:hypothetical protein